VLPVRIRTNISFNKVFKNS